MTFTTQSTAPEPGPSLGQNRLFQALLGAYLLLWIVLAISPVDRKDWLLENMLAMVSVTLLIVTYRRDEWDAQKDTTMAIIGAVVSLGFASLISRSNG